MILLESPFSNQGDFQRIDNQIGRACKNNEIHIKFNARQLGRLNPFSRNFDTHFPMTRITFFFIFIDCVRSTTSFIFHVELVQTDQNQRQSRFEFVFFFVSGGGSALLPLPIEILTLEQKIRITKLIQSKGATIQQLNTVRQSMSKIKNAGILRISKSKNVKIFFGRKETKKLRVFLVS